MEEEETAQILKLSDLISRARPVTGTFGLTSDRLISLSKSGTSDGPPKLSKHTSQNPDCRILKPLSSPAVLVGTLSLPSYKSGKDDASFNFQCSCFQISDGSATICCDILDFCPGIIGKTIRICAWNFIPLIYAGNIGGFLEIIRWECLECISNSSAFSLGLSIDCKEDLQAKYSIFGLLESLSPLSVVPSSAAGDNSSRGLKNLCGFLSKVLVCECKLCASKDSRTELDDLSAEKYKRHYFVKPLTVYFCGSASSWHPIISKLVHRIVSLSGLKKMFVYIGKEDYQVMYLTADKTSLHLPELEKKWTPNEKAAGIRGLGEISSYAGTVTGIYMQGMIVELDQEFLLLLTDYQLLVPHSLRVGAIVSVRNVHFINPKFSWMKVVILGACFITSIRVETFSALEAGCYIKSHSQNVLRKFIDSLTFSARLWYHKEGTTCCHMFPKKIYWHFLRERNFRIKTFTRCFQSEGLAQRYVASCLSSSMYQLRYGVLTEYCKHGLCNSRSEEDYRNLRLMIPISHLVSHSETSWMKMLLDDNRDFNIINTASHSTCISCCGRSYTKQIRRSFCSEDIGVTLLGNLKVSTSSGRLQLSDATGSIDVLITDIPLTWDFNTIYEIEDFTVIMQGVPKKLHPLDLSFRETFTCRNIFNGPQLKKDMKLSLYLHYNFRDQKRQHDMHSPSSNCKGSFQKPEHGRFHLLQLEHKYPLLQKLNSDQAISNRSSVFAEAILLPWDLTFTEKDEVANLTTPEDQQRNSIKYSSIDKFKEDLRIKKCKADQTSNKALDSGKCDAGSLIYRLSNSKSYSDEEHSELHSQIKFPCLVSGRSFKVPHQGFLHCTDGEAMTSSGCKLDERQVFLEFGSDSFHMYEGLRIGGYYAVQHNEKDVLTIKNSSSFFVNSKTCFWSLSILSEEVLKNSDPSAVFQFACPSFYDNKAQPNVCQKHQNSHLISDTVHEICSDINLFVPLDIISYLKIDNKVPHSGQTNRYASYRGEQDVHSGNGLFIREVLSFGTSHSDILLPEGDLISLHGHVLAVHDFNHDSFAAHPRNGCASNIHEAIVSQSICIHVLIDHNMARITGAQGDYECPTGFGEGIHATFHRVLVVGGEYQYKLTPASFIVVNSANDVNRLSEEKSYHASMSALTKCIASIGASPAALSSEITENMDVESIQLRCRVVTLYILVLENRKAVYPSIRVQSSPVINVPLAGFILDDGSSSYCCWANCEKAATLLKLHLEATAHDARADTSQRSRTTMNGKACGSIADHLNKILSQHGRVIVKNYGSTFDSSGLDLTFSVGSGKSLSRSDEDFLRCLMANACSSTLWSIVGTLMDSTAIGRVEQKLSEMGMEMLPLQHIWTAGVCRVDPLNEARERIRGILNS